MRSCFKSASILLRRPETGLDSGGQPERRRKAKNRAEVAIKAQTAIGPARSGQT